MIPYIVSGEIEWARLIPALKTCEGKPALVQFFNDGRGHVIAETLISNSWVDGSYVKLALSEDERIRPSIMIGRTSSDSQLVRIILANRRLVYEDRALVQEWNEAFEEFCRCYDSSIGTKNGKRLLADYGLN